MAVPRNRVSNAKKNSRRSHHAYQAKQSVRCPECSNAKLPHVLCPSCGHYKGRSYFQEAKE